MTDALPQLFEIAQPSAQSRVVNWFSCGAASAVASKLSIEKYGERAIVVYTNPGGEHPDNARFLQDCERWFGRRIVRLASRKYVDHWDVLKAHRFINGANGTHCTGALKRSLRYRFQRPDDIQVFGYTAEEADRAERFRAENFEVWLETPLIEAGITKAQCLGIIQSAGIDLPAMYKLGYRNNNCIGCPKGGMGYWNMIRRDFPEAFQRMATLEREINATCIRVEAPSGGKERLFLDELAPDRGDILTDPDIECSLLCHTDGEAE